MAQFKVGDVVELKSGGPPMTVDMILGQNGQRVGCSWFVGTEHKTGQFAQDALKPWKDED
jgi:uncharacterized protein YodC (DUF2158 family)